jgi:glycerol uptake facilitator-like aquaporin
MTALQRALFAEAIGSLLLFATVIGSGIMAERLAGNNAGIALLGNTLATGAMLFVLITMLGPISGAHFNPAVTLVFRLRREIGTSAAVTYGIAQLLGGIMGAWLAHLMFDLPILQVSEKLRSGPGQWTAEAVATFGLVFTILGTIKARPQWVPASVALYITAAYWFTASTSFANPAITMVRALSNSFAGIAPSGVPAFVAAQFAGAILAYGTSRILFAEPTRSDNAQAAEI